MRSFLGVPYAQPPVGGPALACAAAAACLGRHPRCAAVRGAVHAGTTRHGAGGDERGLSVLEYLGARQTQARHLPVLVWVHGGAFKVGSAGQPLYDGASLARQDLVVVTLNYRLGSVRLPGPSGAHAGRIRTARWATMASWTCSPRSSGSRPTSRPSAVIPSEVTLAGQSAGGAAVYDLMTSPLAAGTVLQGHHRIRGVRHAHSTFAQAEQAAPRWPRPGMPAPPMRRRCAGCRPSRCRAMGRHRPEISGR